VEKFEALEKSFPNVGRPISVELIDFGLRGLTPLATHLCETEEDFSLEESSL